MRKINKNTFAHNFYYIEDKYYARQEGLRKNQSDDIPQFIPFIFLSKKDKEWYLGLIDTRNCPEFYVLADTKICVPKTKINESFTLQYKECEPFKYDTFTIPRNIFRTCIYQKGKMKFPMVGLLVTPNFYEVESFWS